MHISPNSRPVALPEVDSPSRIAARLLNFEYGRSDVKAINAGR